jgi:hypothetical protein
MYPTKTLLCFNVTTFHVFVLVVHNVEESFEDQWGNSYVEWDTSTRGYRQVIVLTFLEMISLQHTYYHT